MKHETTEMQKTAAMRDAVRDANDSEWQRLCSVYGLRGQTGVWRPTQRVAGVIEGLEHLGSLTCLATDGSRAWFLLPDGENVLLGHVEAFEWKEEQKSMVSYYDKAERQEKFFQLVKHRGCPPTLFGMPKRDKSGAAGHDKKARKGRKPKPDAVAQAKALLATLLNQ